MKARLELQHVLVLLRLTLEAVRCIRYCMLKPLNTNNTAVESHQMGLGEQHGRNVRH